MHWIIAHPHFRKAAWTCAALLLAYTLAGFLAAPSWMARAIPDYAEQYLGKRASVGDVRINPYLFTLEVSKLQLDDTPDQPLLKLDRFYVDFELSSIFRRTWTFADVAMDGLELSLAIDRERRLNIMEVMERLKQQKEQKEQKASEQPLPPPSVALERVSLSGGSVHFSDFSEDASGAVVTLSPINLTLTGLSTAPDRKGHYMLEAHIPGGGMLAWKGEATLVPLTSNGEASLRELKLASVWQFFRGKLRMAEPRGILSLSTHYGFSYGEGKAALGLTGMELDLSDLSIAPLAGVGNAPLLELHSMQMKGGRVSLDDREIAIPVLKLSGARASASMQDDGKLNWQGFLPPSPVRRNPEEEALRNEPRPWRVHIGNMSIEKTALAYTDRTLSPPLAFRVGNLDSHFMLDIASGTAKTGKMRVGAQALKFSVEDVALVPVSEGAAPLAAIGSFRLDGGNLDTAARTVSLESVLMSGGGMTLTRDRDGPAGLLRLLTSPARASLPGSREGLQSQHADDAVSEEPPWKYRIGSLELKQFKVQLAERTYMPAVAYDIDAASIAIKGIDSDAGSPAGFDAELAVNGKGSIKGSGTIGQDFKQAKIKLDATGIPLVPLRPAVARHTSADLASGFLAASTELSYNSGASPEMTVAGSGSIQDFRMNETETGDRLISWKALLAQKINLSMAPNQLSIKEIHLHEPGLKLAIDKQRNVNLNQVLKDGSTGKDAPESQPPQSPEATDKEGKNAPFRARIAQLRVEQGTLDFSDMSLVLPFSTRVQALEGSVAGISTSPRSRAELRLSGQVEDYGEANAAGTLLTSDPKRFLDIEANFENIRMPPLSPYSATFAGRKIAAGKLWLTLHYKIVNGNLLGENSIELADFKLGERVEAPGALDLPLDLAIALLKGPNDRINLAVPVRGDVGNPSFDYGKVIRAALANVIRRIVTSPFRMLGGLAGGEDAEQLRKVEFEPGSDDIGPSQRELLDNLAQAMKQRPGVGVTVHGPYDPDRDGESLRRQHVHRDLLIVTGGMVEEEEDLGLIAYGDAETQKALEQLLRERSGDSNAVPQFAEAYKQRAGREPQRVNPVLGLFGRGSRDREFYRAMFDRLVELQPLANGELETLAARRARAISDALRKAGVDSRHIRAGDIQVVTGKRGTGEAEEMVAGELALDVVPAED
jgi:uncharacterized protein involved in outer membrane biogenesis